MQSSFNLYDMLSGTPDPGGSWTYTGANGAVITVDSVTGTYNNGDTVGSNDSPIISFSPTNDGISIYSFEYEVTSITGNTCTSIVTFNEDVCCPVIDWKLTLDSTDYYPGDTIPAPTNVPMSFEIISISGATNWEAVLLLDGVPTNDVLSNSNNTVDIYLTGNITIQITNLDGNTVEINCDSFTIPALPCGVTLSLSDLDLTQSVSFAIDVSTVTTEDFLIYIDADTVRSDNIQISVDGIPKAFHDPYDNPGFNEYLWDVSLVIENVDISGASEVRIDIDNSIYTSGLTSLQIRTKCCVVDCSVLDTWIDNGLALPTPHPTLTPHITINDTNFNDLTYCGDFSVSFSGSMDGAYGYPAIDGNSFTFPSLDPLDAFHLCLPGYRCTGFVTFNSSENISPLVGSDLRSYECVALRGVYNRTNCGRINTQEKECMDNPPLDCPPYPEPTCMDGKLLSVSTTTAPNPSISFQFEQESDAIQFESLLNWASISQNAGEVYLSVLKCDADVNLSIPNSPWRIDVAGQTTTATTLTTITRSTNTVTIVYNDSFSTPPEPDCITGTENECIDYELAEWRDSGISKIETIKNQINLAISENNDIISFNNEDIIECDRLSARRRTFTTGSILGACEFYLVFNFTAFTNGECSTQRKFKITFCGTAPDPDNWYFIEVDFNTNMEIGAILYTGVNYTGADCPCTYL